jgi:hypothetical protein
MADFTGFSYNGVHTSELGLTVVSTGSRLSKNLLPSFKDSTSSVEGRHGNYFYGSTYANTTFNIQTAFDNLHEEQIRRIQQLFRKQELVELIFDEMPYKVYSAKLSSVPRLDFVCFEGPVRIYKGEMALSLVCYSPFARSQFNYLDDYRRADRHYTNIDEWSWASNMKEIQGDYDQYSNKEIKVFNAGDMETDYVLQFKRTTDIQSVSIDLNGKSYKLEFPVSGEDLVEGGETYEGLVTIDTNKHLLTQTLLTDEGYTVTTKVINHYLAAGRLELMPEGEALFSFTIELAPSHSINDIYDVSVQYYHLYL